jgi:hypothetical protein
MGEVAGVGIVREVYFDVYSDYIGGRIAWEK